MLKSLGNLVQKTNREIDKQTDKQTVIDTCRQNQP